VSEQTEAYRATARRVPKYSVFIVLGGLVGFLVTLIVTTQREADPNIGMPALIAYFSLYGITAGVLLGALLALVLDRVGRRKAREVVVEKLHPTDAEDDAAA